MQFLDDLLGRGSESLLEKAGSKEVYQTEYNKCAIYVDFV